MATILTEDPQSLRKLAPELPPAVEAAVARTLARSPDQRFETMDDVAEALDPLAVRSGGASHSARVTTRSSAAQAQDEIAAPRRSSGRLPEEDTHAREDGRPSTKQAMVTAKSPEHPLAPAPQKISSRRSWPLLTGVLMTLAASGVYYKYVRKPVVAIPLVGGSRDYVRWLTEELCGKKSRR